jgi:hypothetical protein
MVFDEDGLVTKLVVDRLRPGWEEAGDDPAEVAAHCAGVMYNPDVRCALQARRRRDSCQCRIYVPAADRPGVELTVSMAMLHFSGKFARTRAYASILGAYAAPATSARPKAAPDPPRGSKWRDAWDACASKGVYFGYCEREDRWWFYDTPAARRFLRHLSGTLTQKTGRVQVKRPRPEELLALPRPAAIKVVAFHGMSWEDARDAIEVAARRWHRRP